MQIYDDQVIEAAYLHTLPGCFFIGPFARRVSFASQQYRALDLVRALENKQKLVNPDTNKAKTIAVVGAGIAGLTAAAALRGQGCTVHLYERHEEPLKAQKHADHRLIHPTISRWPVEELSLTTEFAFLDWFAAPSNVVIKSMRREWEERLAPSDGDGEYLFMPGVTVVRFNPSDEIVRLVTEPSPNIVPDDIAVTAYDYVIVTTGFDEEESLSGLNWVSYWSADKVDQWRRDKKPAYISGCGDGGLIDALRLVHADFDRGWLTIRLAQVLGKAFRDEIRDAEDHALMAAKSIACMNFAHGPRRRGSQVNASTKKVGSRYEDDAIVTRLSNFYQDLAKRLPAAASKLLNDSLRGAGVVPGLVTLVSRQTKPFGPYAAPIHKLMVAHAMGDGRIEYRQGELVKAGKYGAIKSDSRGTTDLGPADGLIIRHGSPANLGGLLSSEERESLRIRQFMLADYIDPDVKRELPAPRGYPDRDSPRYVGTRYEMVQDLLSELLPGATVSATASGFTYELASARTRDVTAVEVPTKVFGLDIAEGEPPRMAWL